MFKKSSKLNIRKRRDTDDENSDEDQVASSNVVSKSQIPFSINFKAKQENQPKKDKPKKNKESKKVSLLSFDDVEEDESTTVKLKKSSRSRRIAKEIKKRSQQEKEALNNPTVASTTSNGNKVSNKPESGNVHVFQSQKAKKNIADSNKTSKKSEEISAIPNFNSGVIPTPSMIHAARKQREMLRKFGSEYIAEEDTQKYKENNQSRLIREDDDCSSDEGIVEMKGVVSKNSAPSKRLVPNESEDEDDPEEEEANADEEVSRWEEEVIKKGLNAQSNQQQPVNQNFGVSNDQQAMYNIYGAAYGSQGYTDNQSSYRRIEAKSDLSFDIVKKRLTEHLNTLKLRNRSNVNELSKLDFETNECEDMSKHLGDVKSISEEYQFYQEMRQYVKDLVGCLRENVRVINSLEQNVHALWKNQSDRLIARRRQDIQDESKEVTSGSKMMQEKLASDDGEYVARVREREARRTRRRAARQIKQKASNHYDGLSTDDEETTMDLAQHNTELHRIETAAATMFDDVLDDFCVLSNILHRFNEWRRVHSNTYNDAYIALCIPKLIFPFIRHKIVTWNPFLSTNHFEEEDWFRELSLFGIKLFPDDGNEDTSNVLDDTKVLSSVVEKVLAVKLVYFIQNVWDPMSTKHTVRLTLLLKDLTRNYPFMSSDNHICQKLIQSLCKRLQAAVDNDIFIPLLPPSSADSPAQIFLERQTWSCIKLFKNALMLDGILSFEVLCEIAFDSVLNRYILLALQTSIMTISCLYKCQQIVDCIPKRWIGNKEIQSHLSSFVRFLVHLAQSVKASQQVVGKTMIKQIKAMLLVIGAKDALFQL